MLISLPIWDAAARPPSAKAIDYPFLLPHEVLADMYENFRMEFERFWLGPEALERFWDSIPDNDPRMIGHPVSRTAGYRQRAIPLRLHGDGVPVGKARGRSWTS
jgi:hypothetical protein